MSQPIPTSTSFVVTAERKRQRRKQTTLQLERTATMWTLVAFAMSAAIIAAGIALALLH